MRRPLFFNLRRRRRREISSPKAMRGVQAVVSMAHMQRPILGKAYGGWMGKKLMSNDLSVYIIGVYCFWLLRIK